MILSVLGWLAAVALLFAFASSVIRGVRDKGGGQWTAASVFACLAVIVLAILGVLPPLWAAILAALPAIAVAGSLLFDKETLGGVIGHVAEGLGLAGGHLRGLSRWLRLQSPSILSRVRTGAEEPGSPVAVVAEAVAARAIPSVMEDPALGLAPEPAELVAGHARAPAPYAALAQYISGFEPEDDMSLRMFMEGNAAGSVMVADAWHHFADTCLNSVGLDPAYVAGILEAGDSAGGHGSLLAQIHKRFGVIYAAVKEWISGHGPLPHKARDFLTGE
jgi:hypothetical protein